MTSISKEQRSLWLLRLYSATGVVPVGAFFVLHLWINARAMQGRVAYEGLVDRLQTVRGLLLIEIVLIHAPLLFHAVYGIFVTIGRVPALPEPPYTRSWSRSMQRMTGIVTFAFVAYHLLELRLPALLGRMRPPDFFPTLCDTLSSTTSLGIPVAATVYLLGLAAASYHLANGLSRFCFRVGLVGSERASRIVSLGCSLLGAALFLLGASTVVYFATGSSFLEA